MLTHAITKAFVKTAEANEYLAKMDLSIDHLLEAVKIGHASRFNAGELHPPTTPGFNAWSDTNYGLSRRLIDEGWSREVVDNIPILLHPNGAYQIVVSSGDIATGTELESLMPSTLQKKGVKFSSLFGGNSRGLFDKNVPLDNLMKKTMGECPTYILLYYFDQTRNETRCELSLPSPADQAKIANKEKQYVSEWQQRIIIGIVGGEPDAPRPDFTEDTDFDITRKTS